MVHPTSDERPRSRTAVFRADSGRGIGFGHIGRCAALAEHLVYLGWTCHLVAHLPRELPFELGMFTKIAPPSSAEAQGAAPHALGSRRHDLLVVDHYGLGAEFEDASRSWAASVVVFDDLADRPHVAAMLIDSADARRGAAHAPLGGEDCELLAGPDYAPLRAATFAARGESRRRRGDSIHRILISLGSGNTADLTQTVVERLASFARDCAIDVVVGPDATDFPVKGGVVVHRGAGNMIELMANADVAIGAGGVGAWERCGLGLPSVALVTAPNQRYVAEALEAGEAAIVVGLHGPIDESSLTDAIGRLMGDARYRRKLARNAARLCDGLGAGRLAAILDSPALATDGAKVRLRRAQLTDGDLMLAWQREPRTRAHAKNRASPTATEHFHWLETKLDDSDCILQMIVHGGEPAGVLRLDRLAIAGESWMVSIHIAPDKYRRGIASAALTLAAKLRPNATLMAEVLPDNTASQRLFRDAGYVWTGVHFERAPLGAERRGQA